MTLAELEREEIVAARALNWCEAMDDGSSLSAARIASARSRHAQAEAALSVALVCLDERAVMVGSR